MLIWDMALKDFLTSFMRVVCGVKHGENGSWKLMKIVVHDSER